jgi:hypothetical protein
LPLRRLLDQRFSELSQEIELHWREAHERGRCEMAGELNQAVRRIAQAADEDAVAVTLAGAAAPFAAGAAVFLIGDGTARGVRMHGVREEAAEEFEGLEIPLESAAALAAAARTREPVVAAATAAEVSEPMRNLAGHADDARVSVFPVLVRDRAAALLYAWGEADGGALELLAQAAGWAWGSLAPPVSELVTIGPPSSPAPASVWDRLPPEEQRVHLQAQRFARVEAAAMRLRHAEAVRGGRARRDIYGALREPIESARAKFRERFFGVCPSMVDYLHLELVGTLANDDPELLGENYPGPLV